MLRATSGALTLNEGAVVDASAGAWRRLGGDIVGGDGGSITINSRSLTPESSSITVASQLRAYGFEAGGTLLIAANSICIAQDDCGDPERGALWLSPDFVTQGGFGAYTLTSNRGDLRVSQDTILRPRLSNVELTSDPRLLASGAELSTLLRTVMRADHERNPVNLTLRTAISSTPTGAGFTREEFADAGVLHVEQGALIDMDVQARLQLESSTRLLFDGAASAPAGDISLLLNASLNVGEFLPSQSLWLGPNARLNAAGAVRIEPSDAPQRAGDVLAGGSVAVRAARGYVLMDPGAVIDVSGARAQLDVPMSLDGRFEERMVASDGGLINVFAAEGAFLSGSMLAHAGDSTARGGRLQFEISAADRADPTNGGLPLFPGNARTVRVTQDLTPLAIDPSTDVPDFLNGVGRLSAQQLEEGGLASTTLRARTLIDSTGAQSIGAIEFDGDVALSLPERLVLDAPTLSANGGVQLSAGYVAIGSTDVATQRVADASVGGGSLNVSGEFIDLVGAVSLVGVGEASLHSAGDLRLRGGKRSRGSARWRALRRRRARAASRIRSIQRRSAATPFSVAVRRRRCGSRQTAMRREQMCFRPVERFASKLRASKALVCCAPRLVRLPLSASR